MTNLLEERTQVRVMMIAPASDGNPRRGCEDPNCPAIKGQEVQILTPDTFAKQPLTYVYFKYIFHIVFNLFPDIKRCSKSEIRNFLVLPTAVPQAASKKDSSALESNIMQQITRKKDPLLSSTRVQKPLLQVTTKINERHRKFIYSTFCTAFLVRLDLFVFCYF